MGQEVAMKVVVIQAWLALLLAAGPAHAQRAMPAVELGAIMGVAGPSASVGLVASPWTIRVSGAPERDIPCSGVQVNLGRVVREAGNAKHTIGGMWGRYERRCFEWRARRWGGYAGIAYTFQAKGFFIEVAPALGAPNSFLEYWAGRPLSRIYGQVGYVHRFGKTYAD
jgi:hypothetical protein